MSGTLATFTVSLYFLNACEEGQRGKAGRYRGCDGEDVNDDTGDDELIEMCSWVTGQNK